MPVLANDDVVVDRNPERLCDIHDRFRHLDVGLRWRRIATWDCCAPGLLCCVADDLGMTLRYKASADAAKSLGSGRFPRRHHRSKAAPPLGDKEGNEERNANFGGHNHERNPLLPAGELIHCVIA